MESLRNWQQELDSLLQHLSEINDGIVAATGEVESLLQLKEQEIDITSDVGSGMMSPVGSGVLSPQGSKPKLARSESQISQGLGRESRQFELVDGVPTVVKTAPRRTTMGGNEEPVKTGASHLAFKLLGPWQERFAVCQEEATSKYNEFFCGWDRLRTQQRRLRLSSQDFRRWFLKYAATVRHVFGFWWSIATMILVFFDMGAVPFALAWPDTLKKRRFLRVYFEISPAFWILDLLFFITGQPLRNRSRKELPFFLCKVLFDASLIVIDIVLVLGILPEEFLPFKLVRLLRTGKFRTALTTLENYAATRGSVNLFYWAGICEALALVLLVNHFLACTMFYVGRLSKLQGIPNWLDETGVLSNRKAFQYLNSFNLVLAQYTPAPFQFQPQNELEQVMVLIIICTCLPLLGSQIGRVSGTLNVLKERSTERERLKRDLHRWLNKTSVPVELVERILDALEDILTSSESPLDLKDPAALTFLPSALTKELSVVKTGRQLHCHPFFNLLMDERLQVAGQLTGAFRSIIAVLGEEIFHRGKKAEGLYVPRPHDF